MADDWGKKIQPTKEEIQAKEEEQERMPTFEELVTPLEELSNVCCLIYGKDGVAKSGLALDYLKILKDGEKMVYIDLDGGALPLFRLHFKDKLKDIKYMNPIVISEETGEFDYINTFRNIKAMILNAKSLQKKENIKVIVFDGLSTALELAEKQMRIEKNLTPDGGVQLMYWKIRNKIFLEALELMKSIPIARIYIAHEDFIVDKESSSVKQKTNQMMFQKILMKKVVDFGKVNFTATLHKSKYDIHLEDETYTIATVDKEKNESDFNAVKVWQDIEDKK